MREPAVIGTLVAAIISAIVLIVFGRKLGTEEEAAIVSVVVLIAGLFVRQNVTPVA